jgi:hypothetical protein
MHGDEKGTSYALQTVDGKRESGSLEGGGSALCVTHFQRYT